MKTLTKRHPEGVKLSDALAADEDAIKARKGIIDKRATMIKAPDATDTELQSPMPPSDDQLEKINRYTRSPKSKNEVVCFSTLSMNNLPDRDDDQFTAECVQDFHELKAPFSFVGKSYMLDHVYKVENAVGRIFDERVKEVKIEGDGKVLFLSHDVYMPNTDAYKKLIEDIDFGINWAVSVGVMLGKDQCSLPWCKAGFSSWGYWCRNGHDKGMYYTEDAEEDSWGYPLPCDSRTSGAQKCLRLFMEPRDGYELSQVFLGAQYYAALEKEPNFAAVMKAAIKGVPTIGVDSETAEKLPLRHVPKRYAEALTFGYKIEDFEGLQKWVDDQGMVWIYDPSDPESGVKSLGKAADDPDPDEEEDDENLSEEDDETTDEEGEDKDAEGSVGSVRGSGEEGESAEDRSAVEGTSTGSEGQLDGGSGSEGDQAAAGGEQPQGGDSGSSDGSLASEDEAKGKGLSKVVVIAAATKAKLSSEAIAVVASAEGDGLDALLLHLGTENQSLKTLTTSLSERATLGDEYLKSLRAEAIAWYVKAHTDGGGPVDVERFEKLLDRFGNDTDLFKHEIEEQKHTAQARFPSQVRKQPPRRHSVPSDPNERKEISELAFKDDEERQEASSQIASRIHG